MCCLEPTTTTRGEYAERFSSLTTCAFIQGMYQRSVLGQFNGCATLTNSNPIERPRIICREMCSSFSAHTHLSKLAVCSRRIHDLRFAKATTGIITTTNAVWEPVIIAGGLVIVLAEKVLSPAQGGTQQRHGLARPSGTFQDAVCSCVECLNQLVHELFLQQVFQTIKRDSSGDLGSGARMSSEHARSTLKEKRIFSTHLTVVRLKGKLHLHIIK